MGTVGIFVEICAIEHKQHEYERQRKICETNLLKMFTNLESISMTELKNTNDFSLECVKGASYMALEYDKNFIYL